MGQRLTRRALAGPVELVAPSLLGLLLVHDAPEGRVAVRLTEVEAYAGESDPASHAWRGRTERTQVMFGPAGFAYVYFTYGMWECMNVVTGPDGEASAVLLRAGAVVDGLDLARARRPGAADRELARGPARLTLALGITRAHTGVDLLDPASPLRLTAGPGSLPPPPTPAAGPRTGISRAAEVPWRFWVPGEETVSPYRSHKPRRGNAREAGRGA